MAFEDPSNPDASETPEGNTHPETPQPAHPGPERPQPERSERRGIVVRRAPKFVPFMVLGALLGIIVAAFVAYGLPGDPSFERSAVFGFFSVAFAAGGVALGSVTALVLDRLSVRRAEQAVVEPVPDNTPEEPEA